MPSDKPIAAWLVILMTGVVSFLALNDRRLTDRLIFWPEAILARKEYYRLVTSAFLHADWQHLLFNMISLYFFGPALEGVIGPLRFLLIYFAGIVGGNLLSLYLHRHQEYFALGASGGVCGIIFSSVFLFPGMKIGLFFVPVGIPGWLYALLFLGSEFYGVRTQRTHIGHDAHLGGALIGLLTTTLMFPQIIRENLWLYLATVGVSGALFLYFWRHVPGRPLTSFWKTDPDPETSRPPRVTSAEEVDAVLDKVSREGIQSLNRRERAILERAARK